MHPPDTERDPGMKTALKQMRSAAQAEPERAFTSVFVRACTGAGIARNRRAARLDPLPAVEQPLPALRTRSLVYPVNE